MFHISSEPPAPRASRPYAAAETVDGGGDCLVYMVTDDSLDGVGGKLEDRICKRVVMF